MPDPALADIDEALFLALADGTRRRLIVRLLEREPVTASALARELPISRQAVSKHLETLASAQLVTAQRVGRETRYHLTPAPLTALAGSLAAVGAAWDARLARLRDFVEGEASPSQNRVG